jgi:glycerol-3-phosphate dehydrogenase
MGEDAVDHAIVVGGLDQKPTRTPDLRLHGWAAPREGHPLAVYGSDAEAVSSLAGAHVPLHPDLPIVESQVRWAARRELARTVEDFLARRTRALLLNARASMEAAPRVADLLAEELGHDAAWAAAQVRAYRSLASGYLLSPGPAAFAGIAPAPSALSRP